MRSALLLLALSGCGLAVPPPPTTTCGEWSQLGPDQQAETADALIPPDLMEVVRNRQQLPPNTADGDVIEAATMSINKVCELEQRPATPVATVVRRLYPYTSAR